MRIGVDIRCLASGRQSGVEEYARQLLEQILTRDRENQYVLFLSGFKDAAIDLTWLDPYPNASVVRIRWPNKLLHFCLWYFRRPYLDRLIGGADIFFLPNLNFASVSPGTKLFVTAHDLSFERYPETFSWKRRIWHFLVNFRGLCRRAHHIFSVSESTAYDLRTIYGIPAKKITAMKSGVSGKFAVLDRNSPELFAVKERYSLPYRFILYLGTIEPRKNLITLLHAYDRLQKSGDAKTSQYSLVIAGAKGWKCDEIFAEIEKHPFRERIIVTDFVRDEDKCGLYNLASLFVYPSLFEGFGLPPVEAMKCGTPVIVSFTSSFPEVIGSAGIMIDPYRPDDLARAMSEVLVDEKLQSDLRSKGLARAAELNWQKVAQEIARRFRE